MGPRSSGLDEIEAGYAEQAAEEEALEMQRGADRDEEEESRAALEEEPDELELAAKQYLEEMGTGIGLAEEEEYAI